MSANPGTTQIEANKMLKEIYGYKNTSSSAGRGEHHTIDTNDVILMNVWFCLNGNPSYGMHLKDGTTYLLIDDYGAMNGFSRLFRTDVKRKKDLI